MPSYADIGIRPLLERNAAEAPDEVFVTFADGSTWTRQQALYEAYRAANVLRERGVRQQQVVAVLLGNGPDFLRCWWGLAALGATCAMFNPAYRGRILDNLLELTGPVLAVTDQQLKIERPLPVVDPTELRNGPATPPELERPIELWDLHGILCTSGTTGRSKAVLQSNYHLHTTGRWATIDVGLGPDDTLLVDLPLFHAGLNSFTVGCLATRSRLAIRSRPEVSRYWEVIRETGSTIAVGLSATAAILQGRPATPDERDHRLRYWIGVPLPDRASEFAERFGISGGLLGAYGCTEIGVGVIARPGLDHPDGSCGTSRDGFELRLVDGNDIEVPTGQVGELILRTDRPWAISHGYLGDHEATARAWRNGWFHTGDALSRDEQGNYYFRDRIKDVIRRRGENISSFEIEAEIASHPHVREAACIAVPSPTGIEDEIKTFLVPEPDFDPAELVGWLYDRLPYFMIPRYIECADELPRTPTGRVRKFELRDRDPGPVWDREQHLRISRDGIRAEPTAPRPA
ncbi:MAG TPA: AMP-binding protein [Pseudonocardia sp.]|nr:AMP-binding protein [Pseudonocardia sp.]